MVSFGGMLIFELNWYHSLNFVIKIALLIAIVATILSKSNSHILNY